MQAYDITNHPYADGITSKAEVFGLHVEPTIKKMVLELKIKHYSDGVYLPELDKLTTSVGDNTVQLPTGQTQEIEQQKVDENGQPMFDENGLPIMETVTVDVTMGDYDLWEYQWDNNVPGPTIMQNAITQLDQSGKINSKCNYRQ